VIFFGFSVEGYSVSLFDFGKICLFSEVNGQVLLNGKPVKDAFITQIYYWDHKPISKTSKVDEQGRFHLEPVFKRSMSKYMPVEASILQEIIIKSEGVEYQGWRSVKRNFDENGELDGKDLNLVCELTNESESEEIGLNLIRGICRWK
jgi:hypothetical protein